MSSNAPKNGDQKYDAVSEIFPGLFLSSINPVYDEKTLRHYNIKAVVSVLSEEPDFLHFSDILYHFIQVDDDESADLLSDFDTIGDLIYKWRSTEKYVLVHCLMGVSRSTTVMMAFLMKRLKIGYHKALGMVHQHRPFACPNRGFAKQLALYEYLKWDITMNNIWFRRYLFTRVVKEVTESIRHLNERYIPTGSLKKRIVQLADAQDDNCTSKYKCRNCRRLLFTNRQVLHFDALHLYVHILPWMIELGGFFLPSGKINCPYCSHKVGRFNWMPPFLTTTHFLFDQKEPEPKEVTNELVVPMVFSVTKSSVDMSAVAVAEIQVAAT